MHKTKILVIHALNKSSRPTTVDFALSFARYSSGCEVHYANILGFSLSDIQDEKFDLLIITYEVLGLRAEPYWEVLVERIKPIAKNSAKKIIFPQDDYMYPNKLEELIIKLDINSIYTPIKNDLGKIYRKTYEMPNKKFHHALTGYLEPATFLDKKPLEKEWSRREIDVGTRVRLLSSQYGSLASQKGRLAEALAELLIKENFIVDISTDNKETLLGNSWFEFLGNIKFTVGRNGGASIVDYKGKISQKYRRFKLTHPEAKLSEINLLHNIKQSEIGDFSAVSPRLFEAAAMGVCQILEFDNYLDLLVPWEDYIPINQDLSNINEVISAMKNEKMCLKIISSCYKKLINSNHFTYQNFVISVLQNEDIEYSEKSGVKFIDRDYLYIKKECHKEISTDILIQELKNSFLKRNYQIPEETLGILIRDMNKKIRKDLIPIESLVFPWADTKFLNNQIDMGSLDLEY